MKTARSVAHEQVDHRSRRADAATTDASPSEALAPTLQRLAGFASLEPDWDGDGATSPTAVAIETAQELLRGTFASWAPIVGEERALPSWVSPLPSGGVQIDWNGPAAELEVDVDPQGAIGYLLQRGKGDQATYDEADAVSPEQVLALLDAVLRS